VVCLYAWSDNEHCHEAHLHARVSLSSRLSFG
jgi:hypothetical protein